LSTITETRPRTGILRWGALFGVGYVVLFALGVILIFGNSPDSSSAPGKIIAYYSQSGHRDRMNFGWLFGGLGVLCFIIFVVVLRQTVRRIDTEDGFLTGLVALGGGVYATLALAALALNVGIGAGAALLVIAASVAGMRAGAVARWLGWVGIVAGIISVGLILFFPWFIFGLWVLVVSIGLFIRSGRTVAATA
jgi:hypothetical protein